MRRALAACALAAGCTGPAGAVFGVDGFVDVALPQRGAVIALWTDRSATPDRVYKYGDGIRVGSQFALGWDADPPPEALNADGLGVAIFALLPELTTVPDGEVDTASLPIMGRSSDTAVVYKTAGAAGPAWSAPLPLRFSCASCVRSGTGGADGFELTPCAAVIIENPAAPLCAW